MVYSTRRFVVYLTMCHFVLVFFSPFSIAITSLGEERANLSPFRTFVRFVLVWICRFPLPLGVWERLRFVIVALPGLFSYLFLQSFKIKPGAQHLLPDHVSAKEWLILCINNRLKTGEILGFCVKIYSRRQKLYSRYLVIYLKTNLTGR